MNPLVTIAIPTYSRIHYLKEAVASALAQTHGPIEVLIGDDGRTESIGEYGRALAFQDRRVRYQRNERNLGLSGNFNALAETAHGEFIVIIGDDDRLLPEFVSTMLAAVQPGIHVAFCNHYLIDSQGARLETESREHTRRYRRDQLRAGLVAHPCQCAWQNSVPMTTTLLRTADVRRLRFHEELNTPDIEFFIRLAQE
ncbi:MAG: glycosyltransferase family 2 protein, partial [Chloroflexi bacterium]|nr:glycosyltransferase family 2 protein [Chloroflexota bacterium]